MQPDVKCDIQETVPITVRTIHFYYSNTPVNTCSHKVSTRNYLQDYYSVLQLTFPLLKAGNRDAPLHCGSSLEALFKIADSQRKRSTF